MARARPFRHAAQGLALHPIAFVRGLRSAPKPWARAAAASIQQQPVLATDRLWLRPYRLADFEGVAEFFASDSARFVGGQKSREAVWDEFCAEMGQWQLLGFGSFAIERKSDGAFIGQVGLNAPLRFPERELGWLLFESFRGHGYASEAARMARDFAFSISGKSHGFDTLVSYIDPANRASQAVAERLGAILDPIAATPAGETCLTYRHHRGAA